jgi:hypothetical protein
VRLVLGRNAAEAAGAFKIPLAGFYRVSKKILFFSNKFNALNIIVVYNTHKMVPKRRGSEPRPWIYINFIKEPPV